jgi:putative DNA primase/helicase
LQPIVDLAIKTNLAVLGISHFSKNTAGRNPTERVTGSLAFGALARVVMAAAKIEDNDTSGGRVFCRAKSNIGPDGGGFRYSLVLKELPTNKTISVSCVVWGEAEEGTARQLLAKAEAVMPERSSLDTAIDFLKIELLDGPVYVKVLQKLAKEAGHSWTTIRRAKDTLAIKAEKSGMNKGWRWSLPSKMLKGIEDGHEDSMSTFGTNEHLQEFLSPNRGG